MTDDQVQTELGKRAASLMLRARWGNKIPENYRDHQIEAEKIVAEFIYRERSIGDT